MAVVIFVGCAMTAPTRGSAIADLLARKRPKAPARVSAPVSPSKSAAQPEAGWLLQLTDEARERQQALWESPRRHFRGSSAGDPCSRSLTLGALGHCVPYEARVLRIFETGKAIERVNVESLRLANLLVEESGQLEGRHVDPPIVCHIDALVRRPDGGRVYLAEIKSIKEELFKKLPPEHGPTLAGESPLLKTHRGYIVQVNTYAFAPEVDCEEAVLLFESKNEQRQKTYWFKRDEQLLEETLAVHRVAAPHILADPQRVAPVPAERDPWGGDPVCVGCKRRYLCRKLPREGASYEETRQVDAKMRG